MIIRPGSVADVDRCLRLDGSYSTQYVWQMEESVGADQIAIAFRRTRIPRHIEVAYPRSVEDLEARVKRGEFFWVASELATIFGYLHLSVCEWQWQGWIEHLIVHRPYRRRGIATNLLDAAEQWAREAHLRAISTIVQPKNDPTICLLLKRGYAFSGFMDRHYENGDVGLVYSLNLPR